MRIRINCTKWRVFDELYILTALLPWKRDPYTLLGRGLAGTWAARSLRRN
jgi:hypothetical protein